MTSRKFVCTRITTITIVAVATATAGATDESYPTVNLVWLIFRRQYAVDALTLKRRRRAASWHTSKACMRRRSIRSVNESHRSKDGTYTRRGTKLLCWVTY